MQKTVKSCKNCTISEVWVQITGKPKDLSLTNPYPLFETLKESLKKEGHELQCGVSDKNKPVLVNIKTDPHHVSLCPPFWNGEIRWTEDNYKKILRTGHQFFALHSLFDKNNSYTSYENSLEKTVKKVIGYITDENAFEAVQITVSYINTIEMKKESDGKFNIGKYLNTNFSYHLENPVLKSNFNYEFKSTHKENRTIGINTAITGNRNDNITSAIRTTGLNTLETGIKINNAEIYNEIKSIKEELKEVFFDIMSETTKTKIMEVRYA